MEEYNLCFSPRIFDIYKFVGDKNIDKVIVGPETADGITDFLQQRGVKC